MTTLANPFLPATQSTPVNRSAPTGANVPSFSLPQNHTLANDPMNQLAQTLSMGMNVPAFDPFGNNGYYSQQTYQQSPLMQRYLLPQNNTQNPWLTTAMQRGMPGWTSNGDGSFKPGQYNPFQVLNAPPTQSGLPSQPAAQPQPGAGQNPYGTVPTDGSSPLDQATYNAYMSDPAVKAYLDAMAAQRAGTASQPQQTGPGPRGGWAGRGAAQHPGVSAPIPGQEFYSTVNRVLGNKAMAAPGDYAGGWNQESSPNTRFAARQDANLMQQALGRQLTRNEIIQLNRRQQGWGYLGA